MLPFGRSAEWIATAGSGIRGPHCPTCSGLLPPLLETVTVAGGEVAVSPTPSRARAAIACEPLATVFESQLMLYGAVVSSAPTGLPSRRNWTPAIPLASEAVAERLIVPDTVAPPA